MEGEELEVLEHIETTDAEQPAQEAAGEAQAAEVEEKVAPRTNKRIRDLLSERDHWKQEALKAQAEQNKPAPKLEDYDHDIEKFTEAAVEHKANEIAVDSIARQAADYETRAAKELENTFNEITKESVHTYPDFDKVFDKDVPVSIQMAESIVISDKPAEIAYYLGTNRDVAAKIASMPPHLQGYEIARLEARLSASPIESKAPPPPTRTVAGTNATGKKSYEEMSDEEFESVRRKEREAYRNSRY